MHKKGGEDQRGPRLQIPRFLDRQLPERQQHWEKHKPGQHATN